MAEYTSTARKAREIVTSLMFFGVSIGIFYLSYIPSIPFPVAYQVVALLLLVAGVYIITRFVLRRYTCRLEPAEDGSVDFVVIEHFGKRNTVVCRVYARQIKSAARWDKQAWKTVMRGKGEGRVYRYTGGFSDPDRAIVEITGEDSPTVVLLVAANDAFLAALQPHISGNSSI